MTTPKIDLEPVAVLRRPIVVSWGVVDGDTLGISEHKGRGCILGPSNGGEHKWVVYVVVPGAFGDGEAVLTRLVAEGGGILLRAQLAHDIVNGNEMIRRASNRGGAVGSRA